jgi:uncharacterized protein (DUF1697 family)
MAGSHLALLRGINVGKAKRVAMADLRSLVADLGYLEVRTLLNSGNVIFRVPGAARGDPAGRIERAIVSRLGVSTRVTVLTAAELAAIVHDNPLLKVASNPSCLLVSVLSNPDDRARLEPLLRQVWAPEAMALGPRVCYLWCPSGILESRLAEAVNGLLRDAATARNWATILKLHDLVSTGE